MISPTLVLATGDALASWLVTPLEAAGFSVTRLLPAEARPAILSTLEAKILVLETATPLSLEELQPYWDDQPMDQHLPILLLEASGPPAFHLDDADEPVDRAAIPTDPGEVVARVQGLLRERTIRTFRRHFHDLSQPLTIARAFSQRAVKQVAPGDPVYDTLAELDRQVERMFRIAEDLQRRRME